MHGHEITLLCSFSPSKSLPIKVRTPGSWKKWKVGNATIAVCPRLRRKTVSFKLVRSKTALTRNSPSNTVILLKKNEHKFSLTGLPRWWKGSSTLQLTKLEIEMKYEGKELFFCCLMDVCFSVCLLKEANTNKKRMQGYHCSLLLPAKTVCK